MSARTTRSIPAAQCEGKEPFATFYTAKRIAGKMGAANPYRCPHCHQFHVGHQAPKAPVRQPRRAAVPVDDFEDI